MFHKYITSFITELLSWIYRRMEIFNSVSYKNIILKDFNSRQKVDDL